MNHLARARPRSLRTTLFSLIVVAALLPVAVLGIMEALGAASGIWDSAGQDVDMAVRATSTAFRDDQKILQLTLLSYTQDPDVAAAVIARDRATLIDERDARRGANGPPRIVVVDSVGTVILDDETKDATGLNPTTRAVVFARALTGQQDVLVVTGVRGGLNLLAYAPIWSGQRIVGAALSNQPIDAPFLASIGTDTGDRTFAVDAAGRIVGSSLDPRLGREVRLGSGVTTSYATVDGQTTALITIPLSNGSVGAVSHLGVALPLPYLDYTPRMILRNVMVDLGLGMIGALLFALLVGRLVVRPIEQIAAATAVARGERQTIPTLTGSDELAALSRALGTMRATVEPSPSVSHTILVCDDDPTVLDVVRQILEARGDRVVTRESGSAALETALEVRPDAILLDMVMPGMCGWETMHALKRHPGTSVTPIVVFSRLEPGTLPYADLGISGWVSKPLDERDLAREIDRVLARSSEAPLPGAAAGSSPILSASA